MFAGLTIGVPLVLSTQQQQEVLYLHHAMVSTVVRHDWGREGKEEEEEEKFVRVLQDSDLLSGPWRRCMLIFIKVSLRLNSKNSKCDWIDKAVRFGCYRLERDVERTTICEICARINIYSTYTRIHGHNRVLFGFKSPHTHNTECTTHTHTTRSLYHSDPIEM